MSTFGAALLYLAQQRIALRPITRRILLCSDVACGSLRRARTFPDSTELR